MACAPELYNRRLSGEPVEFEARLTVLEKCSLCKNDAASMLKRHMKEYHWKCEL
jgi:hypothetical protein